MWTDLEILWPPNSSHEEVFTIRASGMVYKLLRVVFRSEEVDVVEVGLSLFRFSFIYQEMLGDRVLV